jgi:hypothetical protein
MAADVHPLQKFPGAGPAAKLFRGNEIKIVAVDFPGAGGTAGAGNAQLGIGVAVQQGPAQGGLPDAQGRGNDHQNPGVGIGHRKAPHYTPPGRGRQTDGQLVFSVDTPNTSLIVVRP